MKKLQIPAHLRMHLSWWTIPTYLLMEIPFRQSHLSHHLQNRCKFKWVGSTLPGEHHSQFLDCKRALAPQTNLTCWHFSEHFEHSSSSWKVELFTCPRTIQQPSITPISTEHSFVTLALLITQLFCTSQPIVLPTFFSDPQSLSTTWCHPKDWQNGF